ncbi:probable 30S ribosomal protein S18 at C-terminar half [Coccomyxa sp. Obi]|nr:probable 30S ribosomal protein S18 at C-terminar half [Coccomyxa sp. Obi]
MSALSSLLRHAAAAHRSVANGKLADLVQRCTRDQQAFENLPVRTFLSSCRVLRIEDERTDSSGITEETEQGNTLPENATAAEMRQWADRMLGQKAASKSGAEDHPPSSTPSGVQELQSGGDIAPEQADVSETEDKGGAAASVSGLLEDEEESLLPEDYDLAVEEGDVLEAAAAVDVPMGHEDVPAAEMSTPEPQLDEQEEEAPSEAWVRFVEDTFGQEVRVPTVRGLGASQRPTAAAETGEKGDVPDWRRFMPPYLGEGFKEDRKDGREEAARQAAADSQSVKLPDFFNMKDPRKELERLLPKDARRHDLAQYGFIQPLRDDADRASSAAAPVTFKASAPLDPSAPPVPRAEPPPRRVTVVEPPMDRLANPVTGYANLGRPRSERLGAQRDETVLGASNRYGHHQESPRLHPTRMFYPGQTYDPEDLVEAAEHIGWKRAVRAPGEKASNGDVRAQADFRNQAFLNRFISELGKLPPKRTTRLQQKTHRHLCRQIKLARQMALLPIDTQLSREYLQRTGSASQDMELDSGTEHNPHLRAHMQERRMGFPGPRGGSRPRFNDSGDTAGPPRPSRWSNMGAPAS